MYTSQIDHYKKASSEQCKTETGNTTYELGMLTDGGKTLDVSMATELTYTGLGLE